MNVTLFGLSVVEGEGAREDWAGTRGSGLGLTGLGWVGLPRAGPWIKAGGDRSGSGVPSDGTWVEGRVLVCVGLGFEAEELMVLSGWASIYVLILATQDFGISYLTVNCCLASIPDR